MAQNFRRYTKKNAPTTAGTAIITADSFDTIVGISLSNTSASQVIVDCYINDGVSDIYIIKDAPIPAGSTLQVLDGGAKFVIQSGDELHVISDTANAVDVWVSAVDAIST